MIVLIGLNEISFDLVRAYINIGKLPTFKKILENETVSSTIGESEYHLLEPWIQWVTIHTGKKYSEHKVFRLGDIVNRDDLTQLYEVLEMKGFTVGAVSPFNASNRGNNKSLFFVPDPWTKTTTKGSWFIKSLSAAVSDAVNNNAGERIKIKSLFTIAAALIIVPQPTRWPKYLNSLLNAKMPGSKAKVLDMLLIDLYLKLVKKNKPQFSELFLNAGAHIQHHYLKNSSVLNVDKKNPEWYCPSNADPLLDILEEYDNALERIYSQYAGGVVIATGLSQIPHQGQTYYYRLKEPVDFLSMLGCSSTFEVDSRMSRDFIANFNSKKDCADAEVKLRGWTYNHQKPVFSVDNRGTSLFLEFVVDDPIDKDIKLSSAGSTDTCTLTPTHVDFVALKNGEHASKGTLVFPKKHNLKNELPLELVFDELIKLVESDTAINA